MNTKLEQQADLLFANINGWEQSVLERIGKRINKIGKMSVADVQALNNIADVKGDMKEITKELARVTGLNVRQIEKIYADTLTEQHLANKPLYDYRNKVFVPFEDNIELQAIAKAYARSTAKEMVNLSKTKMLRVRDKNGRFVKMQKGYYDILDRATMQVASGATDFHTAMRESIKQMGSGGMRVEYESGVHRRLDTVVRQNLLWGAKQASIAYNEMIGEELGCDGIEIDYHSNPRPSHADMQGKQYVLGRARIINGKVFESADVPLKLLDEYNCYHYKTPIICGISEPRYSSKELAELKKRDKQKYNIDGHEMTGYQASQAMRRLETAVREQKSMKAMYQASGDPLAVRECNERIKRYKDKYAEISDITGIAQDKKRMTLTSADKIKGTSTPTTPKPIVKQPQKSVKNVDNSAKSGIINNIKSKQGVQDVHYIGKIDKNIYKCVTEDIRTDEVIITDERIQHIKERHPNDYERYCQYISQAVQQPEYIVEANKPNTALILKSFTEDNKQFKTVLKLVTSNDDEKFKNSIITFMKIDEKEWKRLIKNKKTLYKSE